MPPFQSRHLFAFDLKSSFKCQTIALAIKIDDRKRNAAIHFKCIRHRSKGAGLLRVGRSASFPEPPEISSVAV
jgi:hypothetical protein